MNMLSLLHFQSKIIIFLFRSLDSPRLDRLHMKRAAIVTSHCVACVDPSDIVQLFPPPSVFMRERKKEREKTTDDLLHDPNAAHLLSRALCTDNDDYVNASAYKMHEEEKEEKRHSKALAVALKMNGKPQRAKRE